MSSEPIPLSPLKQAYLALEAMQDRIDAFENAQSEPIAIVGMACRFPGGADHPEAFWQLLHRGVDAITEVPADRWDMMGLGEFGDALDDRRTCFGGFLREPVDQFDPQFFGISPREAINLDPQHRLLLEVSWEALEDAGQIERRLSGSRTGVFIGITSHDYSQLISAPGLFDEIDTYLITGNSLNASAGRLSYTFGFHGPSMAIDTACSSSLVAVHQACRGLLNHECDQALAGGVNLMLSPVATIALARGGVLAPDGRCKAFAAAADGMVRGEGCAVIVMKRIQDALANGDNVLAVIRGSAVNQDGPSSGLTVPHGPAQESVIRQALKAARLDPNDVDYIEAHGTGTSLGDPIEARALGNTYGQQRDRPLLLGSLKTNIGHLEAASGIAGILKVVLSLKHGRIPAHLHFQAPSPHIPWKDLPLEIPVDSRPWPAGGRPRAAGVSSFGFSGTNAHVIIQEMSARARNFGRAAKSGPFAGKKTRRPVDSAASDEHARVATDRPLHVLALSAKTPAALTALAKRYEQHLALCGDAAVADVCFSANTGRAQLSHRLTILAGSLAELRDSLGQAVNSENGAYDFAPQGNGRSAAVWGAAHGNDPNSVESPKRIVRFGEADVRPPKVAFVFPGRPLAVARTTTPGRELYDTQPLFRDALHRCQDALRDDLSWPLLQIMYGDKPARTEDARSAELTSFSLQFALAQLWLAWGVQPALVAGSGTGEHVAACLAGVFSLEDALLQLAASHQSPSLLQNPARHIAYAPPQIPIVTLETGRPIDDQVARPEYWRRNVQLEITADCIQPLSQFGSQIALLMDAAPATHANAATDAEVPPLICLASLHAVRSDWRQMLGTLAELFVRGVSIDWRRFDSGYQRRRIALPFYPFQRERYWVESSKEARRSPAPAFRERRSTGHPLLGDRLPLAGTDEIRYESRISLEALPYLRDHRVLDNVLVPAAAFLEMALAAGKDALKMVAITLSDVAIEQALVLPELENKTLQTVLTPQAANDYAFQIFSLSSQHAGKGFTWTRHVCGKIQAGERDSPSTTLRPPDPAALRSGADAELSIAAVYESCRRRGIDLGLSFQAVRQLWPRPLGHGALGRIELDETLASGAGDYQLHPVLLDASFQVLNGVAAKDAADDVFLPVALDQLRLFGPAGHEAWGLARVARISSSTRTSLKLDVDLLAADGRLIASASGLHLAQADARTLQPGADAQLRDWLYEVHWRRQTNRTTGLPPDFFQSPRQVEMDLRPALVGVLADHDTSAYQAALANLEELSAGYVSAALRELGVCLSPGEEFTTDAIADECGVTTRHRKLLIRCLGILAEEGILSGQDDHWQVLVAPNAWDLAAQVRTLLDRYPDAEAELTLLDRCGSMLAQVLRGECDPLGLLFPGDNSISAAQLYQDSPGARLGNTVVQQVVRSLATRLPQDRMLRVLEIGAGTGGTTSYLLPELPAEQTEYYFTDVTAAFIGPAEDRFRDYGFMRYKRLDIERSPVVQGFEREGFDLVIAANVLHATRDLKESLQHVRELMVRGGMLLLLEGTRPLRFIDLMFGMTEGWWRFADADLRPSHPLLGAAGWQEALETCDFDDARVFPASPETEHAGATQVVMLAQAGIGRDRSETREPRRWLVFNDFGGVGRQLQRRLELAGDACVAVAAGDEFSQESPGEFRIDPGCPEHFQRLLESMCADDEPPLRGIVYLWGVDVRPAKDLDIDELQSAVRRVCEGALHVVQAVAAAPWSERPALWLVSRGAQPADSDLPGLGQSPAWGFGKVITLEHPEIRCVRVDLDPRDAPSGTEALLAEILSDSPEEDEVAFRGGERLVARLVRHPEPKAGNLDPLTLRPDGSYLVTGGLGGLGLLVARWMVERGARRLLLLGRNRIGAEATAAVANLRQLGASVEVIEADVSDFQQMTRVFARVEDERPLRGIVHSAGVLDDGILVQQTWSRFRGVLAPKVQGAWNMHVLSQDRPLDFFVLFSSAAALLGSAAQSNHAAANAFLDALAHYRRAQGMPALSINWGAWSEVGAATRAGFAQRASAKGMGTIAPDQGMQVFEQLLVERAVQVGVVPIDWTVFRKQALGGDIPPFLEEILGQEAVPPERQPASAGHLLRRLAESSSEQRRRELVAFTRQQVAEVLRLPVSRLDVRQPLNSVGLDSLMAVELRNRFRNALGVDVPMVQFLEDIDVQALAAQVDERLTNAVPATRTSQSGSDRSSPWQAETHWSESADNMEPKEAERLLAQLDQLSDAEVDALLYSALAGGE